jgi:prepilin peptidase CpaA
MWLIGSGGGGDVKFMGALGAWIGAVLTVQVFILSAVIIVVGSAIVLAMQFVNKGMSRTKAQYLERGETKKGRAPSAEAVQRQRTRRRLMPFGVPAAVATWLVLAFSLYSQ